MSIKTPKPRHPMGDESMFFLGLTLFFVVVTLFYGFWSAWEPIGSTALALLAGLNGFTGFYLLKLTREIDDRPEDNPLAEIEDYAGEYARFSPWSWWPLVLGIAVSLIFLGPALHQWWLMGIGGVIGAIGLVGQVLEFSRGHHAH